MEQHIVEYQEQEQARLSAHMPPKQITLLEDENFHDDTCLVALEPVSDFLWVERKAEHRDAATWNQAVAQGLRGMPVQVVQVTSDEAKGIINHAQQGLGAHRGPDVFHVQHEVSRGTSCALWAKTRQAENALEHASQQWQEVLLQQQEYQDHPGPGRPPDFAARLEGAQQAVQQAQAAIGSACVHKEAMHKVVRDIGALYHPFDLHTGVPTTPAELNTSLSVLFHKARQLAKAAQRGESAKQRLEKAARVVPARVATVAFFHVFVRARITQYLTTRTLPASIESLVHKVLLPAHYLLEVANKAPTAAQRPTLEQAATQLLCTLLGAPPWLALEPAVQQGLGTLARECAQVFQRSSSAVEGRNGQLALGHHHLHHISDRKLHVLTVLHNYFVRRQDGTTAAERFFGAPAADLFQTLCARLEAPPRPRKRRNAPPAPQLALAA